METYKAFSNESLFLPKSAQFTSAEMLFQQVLGPLAGNTLFTEDDFKLLENFDMDLYARKVRDQVRSYKTL